MYLVRSSYLVKKLYPKAVWRADPGLKKLYLTFDDGPVPDATPFILDLLKEKNIRATFFCVGENVEKNPALFERILKDGHRTGNHTFNHVNGWNTHTDDYLDNVERCSKMLNQYDIKNNDGRKPLFRPPYGKLKRSQYSILKSRYDIIMWDVLTGDYDKDTSEEKCLRNAIDTARNGSIIVFHDSTKARKNMEYALPRFIEYALSKGYEFDAL
jgi:peptidoglycan/xylan/chitin deacetylase (PgdA/CDA1 family)